MSIVQHLHLSELNYVICIWELKKKNFFSAVNGLESQIFTGELSVVDLAWAVTEDAQSRLVRKERNYILSKFTLNCSFCNKMSNGKNFERKREKKKVTFFYKLTDCLADNNLQQEWSSARTR